MAMKHISEILSERRPHLAPRALQMSMFDVQSEKGGREWAAFGAPREEKPARYRLITAPGVEIKRKLRLRLPAHAGYPQSLSARTTRWAR
ncbi:MAG: hypothetical protein NUV59_01050 [Patescibacteria group bacterium]|nr:hypothetical protein [Patescibacteria group bacterium]